jgi:tetratricopeptide (TPR) repeat protein
MKSAFQNELLKDQIGLLKRKSGAPESHWSTTVSIQMADKAAEEADRRGAGAGTMGGSTSAAEGETTISTKVDASGISPDKKYLDFAALEDINRQRVAFYERMIAADIDSLGPDHPSVARDLNGLASIYLTQHNYSEAKPLLMRALVIYEKAYLADSSPAKQTRLLLQLISTEQDPATASIDTSYIDSLPRIPAAAQKLEVALRLNDLAFMLYRQGKVPTALQVYYWALASTANSTGDSSILSAASMADMSRALRSAGRNAEAAKLEGNAGAIARRDILEKRSKLLPR